MCASVRHRAGRPVVILAAALLLAVLPLELRLDERALPTVAVAKVMAKDGGKGSDDSGSENSGSDDSADSGGSSGSGSSGSGSSGSGSSGADDSGSSGQGGGDDASGDDDSGSGTSGGSETSGSSSGHSGARNSQRSIGEFRSLLKKKGEIARVTRSQGGVVVRYTDGWREQVVGGSYQLIDRRDRIVVKRPASRSDLQRLLAAAP